MSGGGFDKTYSLLGTYIGGKLEKEVFLDNRFKLFYNTFFRSKYRIGILIALIIEQIQIFFKIPSVASVWLYNVSSLNVILYVLLKIFKPTVLINIIQLDFTPVEKGFGLNNIFLKIFNNSQGNIRLSESPLFINKNSITLPGVVPHNSGDEPRIEFYNNKYLLSGVLTENISQLSMVLDTFSQLPSCELHITGKIDDDSLILKYSQKYFNIFWYGNVSFKEYLDIMHSCTYQLSTRNPNYIENQCNFPSKIIEALLHNRIIISTIEYKQIENVKYFIVDSDADSFRMHIDRISKLSIQELIGYANQGKRVSEIYSPEVWNKSMSKIEGYEKI